MAAPPPPLSGAQLDAALRSKGLLLTGFVSDKRARLQTPVLGGLSPKYKPKVQFEDKDKKAIAWHSALPVPNGTWPVVYKMAPDATVYYHAVLPGALMLCVELYSAIAF